MKQTTTFVLGAVFGFMLALALLSNNVAPEPRPHVAKTNLLRA
jgi:hypothetical protein